MNPVPIDVPGLPPANATFHQATRLGGLLFVSGQLGIDPETGQLAPGGQAAEYRQALENIRAILEAAGSSPGRVAKTVIYMTNVDELAALNDIYIRYFPHGPAKTGVEVKRLSMGAAIEIEVTAAV
jgi:reactive intermediate/imine deaminase